MKDFIRKRDIYIPVYNLKYIFDDKGLASDDIAIFLSFTNGLFFGFLSLLF